MVGRRGGRCGEQKRAQLVLDHDRGDGGGHDKDHGDYGDDHGDDVGDGGGDDGDDLTLDLEQI